MATPKTYVCGHRNPDVDSIMSAVALADLRRRQGDDSVEAICPGVLPSRPAWLFKHFDVKPPRSRADVYPRVSDVMSRDFATVAASKTLYEAVAALRRSGALSIPVVEKDGRFLGMLSPLSLLAELLHIGVDESHRSSLTGRTVFTSVKKVAKLLEAEFLSGGIDSELRTMEIFVAAMSLEFFERHLQNAHAKDPVVIVGDRPEIHLRVLQHGVRLLIITGSCPVEDAVVELARAKGVTVLRTRFDSANVLRRLKFSTPARNVPFSGAEPLEAGDMLHNVRARVLSAETDLFPVCDGGRLVGVLRKADLTAPPPCRMILVDHNEFSQSIPGADELPLAEVVDHHRIALRPTTEPIRYTCDAVGSTCTLVAAMYRAADLEPDAKTAALLLSGIVTDTLLFQSPTTTERDRTTAAWLESLSGVSASALMADLTALDSPLATMSPAAALASDRKDYDEHGRRFALAQIEESNLAILHRLQRKLTASMERTLRDDRLDFFGLLITDAVRGNSEFLGVGDPAVLAALPYKRHPDGTYLMPGVLSRKKQLLPQLLAILADLPPPHR